MPINMIPKAKIKWMNSLLFFSRIALSFGIFICLTTYAKQEKPIEGNTDLSTEVYTVLVEKAMTLQTDFTYEAWADMLSEDVVFVCPDDGDSNQIKIVGKSTVLAYWKTWQQDNGVASLTLSGFNHAPCQSNEKGKVIDLAGIYVFSLVSSKWVFKNGQIVVLPINFCHHFNPAKRIDRCFIYYDRMPVSRAAKEIKN